jgi:uncharacterized protein
MIRVGLSLQASDDIRLAQLPLFEAGIVDAVEWTPEGAAPGWLDSLAKHYAGESALYTHLVEYALSGDDSGADTILAAVRACGKSHPPQHVSAHFGLSAARDFAAIAPLPPVKHAGFLDIARERLMRLHDAAECPVGVENLALAFTIDDVKRQGEWLEAILPSAGFVLLDLHNVYCQAHNFDIDPIDIVRSYPLARVREIHISGGSFMPLATSTKPFRRDSHDDLIPEAVFRLLAATLPVCPAIEFVCLERLAATVTSPEAAMQLHRDFRHCRELVAASSHLPWVDISWPNSGSVDSASWCDGLPRIEGAALLEFEHELARALAECADPASVRSRLMQVANDAATRHYIEGLDPFALEAAMAIERKWARRM